MRLSAVCSEDGIEAVPDGFELAEQHVSRSGQAGHGHAIDEIDLSHGLLYSLFPACVMAAHLVRFGEQRIEGHGPVEEGVNHLPAALGHEEFARLVPVFPDDALFDQGVEVFRVIDRRGMGRQAKGAEDPSVSARCGGLLDRGCGGGRSIEGDAFEGGAARDERADCVPLGLAGEVAAREISVLFEIASGDQLGDCAVDRVGIVATDPADLGHTDAVRSVADGGQDVADGADGSHVGSCVCLPIARI